LGETNIAKSRRRRGFTQKAWSIVPREAFDTFKPQSNGKILGPLGKLSAGAALARLEKEEEQDTDDSRLHWRTAMRLRSIRLKLIGCELLRHYVDWIANLKFRDAAKNASV
jgi:hypothetical protein